MSSKKSSKVGFGCWGIGGSSGGLLSYGALDETVACSAIEAALSSGINFFDTSPAYGEGTSERLIGAVCKERRHNVFLATKIGVAKLGEEKNFNLEEVKKSLLGSFDRLKTDYIDLIQLHDPEFAHTSQIETILPFLNKCKENGTIGAVGISLKNPADFEFWSKISHFDYFQVNFNVLDQRILESGLPNYCLKQDAKVIARTALCFGFLSDSPPVHECLDPSDHRLRWSAEQFKQWNIAANEIFRNISVSSKAELALRFCLSFPWVEVVLAGILSPEEALKNADIGRLGPLSLDSIEKIKENYKVASKLVPRPN